MDTYKKLVVWQKSIKLVKEIYKLTEKFPNTERFGLTNQMRRVSVSVPSNIVEGYARKSRKEYAQFINIAYGSAMELETQIIIAKELDFTNEKETNNLENLLEEVYKMLYVFRERLYN